MAEAKKKEVKIPVVDINNPDHGNKTYAELQSKSA